MRERTKLTRGGSYLLNMCDEKSYYEDEEICMQIKTIQGQKEVEYKKYLRCECTDGREDVNVYIELSPTQNQQTLKKNDLIIIQSYINEKKPNGIVIVLVTQFQLVKSKTPSQLSTTTVKQSHPQKSLDNKMGINTIMEESMILVEDSQDAGSNNRMNQKCQLTAIQPADNHVELLENQVNSNLEINHVKQNERILISQANNIQKFAKNTLELNKVEVINLEDNYSNNTEATYFGGKSAVGPLSDKLNKRTLLVSELKVGLDKYSFKFEGRVQQKSEIKHTKNDKSKHFFIRAVDSMNQEINISFWSHVDESYETLQINSTYYFIGGEINKFYDKIELKFKSVDFEIIPKDSLNYNNNTTNNQVTFDSALNFENQANQHSNGSNQKENQYERRTTIQQEPKQNFQSSSMSSKSTNDTIIKRKKLQSISEILSSSKQYLSVVGQVMDILLNERNIKLKIQDNSSDQQLEIMIFPELFYQWKDKFEVNKWYYFYEFVRQVYQGDVQLKNNRLSQIEEAYDKQPLIIKNKEQETFQKQSSIISNEGGFNGFGNENNNINNNKGQMIQKNYQMNMGDFNKVSTINEIIASAQCSEIGQRRDYIVYGQLVSIQMKNKLYYYRCICNTKATLKTQANTSFCESCQSFVSPSIQLMLRAFIQDSTGNIPVILFDQQSSQLINQLEPSIKQSDAGLFVKNCMENGQEETLRQLFCKLDYKRYKFELQFENKEFNNEQEITYKILKIEKENCKEESKYLCKKLEVLIQQSNEQQQNNNNIMQ